MADLCLKWLGPPAIEYDGNPLKLEMRKTLALLAYLSSTSSFPSRETLASLFWPEYDQQHALLSLRRNLSSLSKSLPFEILQSDREKIGYVKTGRVKIDVDEFLVCVQSVEAHVHKQEELCPACIANLENAASLYRGAFLEGFNLKDCPGFDEWQYFQRESLQTQLAAVLEKLAIHHASRGEWEQAIRRCRSWLSLDRLHEPAQRMLMQFYLRAGQRSAALRQYEECTQILQQELGQAPDAETLKIYAQIRSSVPARAPLEQNLDALIRTKLRMPFTRPEIVPRAELQSRIIQGLQFPLTLIVAPAGFGKTTLVAASLAQQNTPVAWLSLDKDDNQAGRFLKYLTASLQNADRRIGSEAAALLSGMAAQPPETALASLINDLDAAGEDMVLVLEDYQFIHSQEVHSLVTFLLEHSPHSLHTVMVTRSDPPLPLARLRARSHVVELRAADLRFSRQEADQFLNAVMGLHLDERSVAVLEERTEGWVAGLQMAALSMRDQADADRFIDGFSGTNRFVLEYLSEEVLNRLPEETRTFLLHTSILEKLCGSLCDAVIGRLAGSRELLERIDKANLFLIPLDDECQWYRYHHLFAELLRARLLQTVGSQEVAVLHARATGWYEVRGLVIEAIHHASLTADDELVERLIEQNYDRTMQVTERASFRFLTGRLSKELICRRPRLSIYAAESSLWFGQLEEAEEFLAAADPYLQDGNVSPELLAMRGHYAYVSSRIHAMRGDFHRAVELGGIARECSPAGNLALRLNIGVLLGYTCFLAGDYSGSYQALLEVIQSVPAVRDVVVATRCVMARLYAARGWLGKSYDLYQSTAKAIQEAGGTLYGATSIVNVGIAGVLFELNDLDAALAHILHGLELIQYWGKADDIALAYTTLAQIQHARGNMPAALEAIQKGLQVIQTSRVFCEARDAVLTEELRIRLAQGDQPAINRLARPFEKRLGQADAYRCENELALLTLARVYRYRKNLEESIEVISCLEERVQAREGSGRLIQVLTLKALVMQSLGKNALAQDALEKSLHLAEPEGYIRSFVDDGQPMQLLLARWQAQASPGPLKEYARFLLSQFDSRPQLVQALREKASPVDGLAEPLSPRELEILGLLAEGKTNRQIAATLVVTPGTVKAHTASIYRKMDAANRTAAVARGRELGLLP